ICGVPEGSRRIPGATGCNTEAIEVSEMGSYEFEARAIPVTEVALAAVQHEAHKEAPIHVDRHRHDVIDPDRTVVIAVERSALKFGLGQQVTDSLRHRAGIAAMLAHQRVSEEVPV